jgi:glucose/mannose transport system substrate-binding protein
MVGLTCRGAVVLAADAPTAEPKDAASAFVFYHWLDSRSEENALGALVGLFKGKYPDVAVKPLKAPFRGTAGIFPVIAAQAKSGRAPDAFMLHVGYSARIFLEGDLIGPVDDLWAGQLEDVVPPVIRSMCRLNQHYYAVPLNVHRTNLVWYNASVLQKNEIDPTTLGNWGAFFAAARKLRRAGMRAPIQLGADWTAGHALECIVASLGMPAYEAWINGQVKTKDDPRLLEALHILKDYLDLVNDDHATVPWDVGVKRLREGSTAFYMMGDWMNGELAFAGLQYGKDYGAIPVPGTGGMYGLTVDAFGRPGKTQSVNAERWLKLVASREGQDAFSLLKGSIPARTDTTIGKAGGYQRAALADFKSANAMYPSFGAAVPIAYKSGFDQAVSGFVANRDIVKAAAAFADVAAGIQSSFIQTWSLRDQH